MTKYKVGIAGIGMVGGALEKYYEKKPNYQLFLYDKFKKLGSIDELNKASFIFICVPTPYVSGVGCDTSIIEEVLNQITSGKVVVIKSTIIPGTTEDLQKKYPRLKILFNPEFLTELSADQDMSYPDRQIIGYTDKSYTIAKEILMQLPLAPFERIVPATEAEMIKYMGNSWFAIKVTVANQFYELCEQIGIDYKTVLEGVGADKRIGRTHLKIFHHNYRGYGGKCFPKDTKAILDFAEKKGIKMSVLSQADSYNDTLLKKQRLDPLNTDTSPVIKKDTEKRYSMSKEIKIKKHD